MGFLSFPLSTDTFIALQAVFTLALVIITIYYAWANKQMVNEMKRARESENNPNIKVQLIAIFVRDNEEMRQISPPYVDITNIGRGLAYNLQIIAINNKTKEKIKGRIDTLKSGDSESPFFEEQVVYWNTKVFENEYSVIVEYENLLEEKVRIVKKFDKNSSVIPDYSKPYKKNEAEVLSDIHKLFKNHFSKK